MNNFGTIMFAVPTASFETCRSFCDANNALKLLRLQDEAKNSYFKVKIKSSETILTNERNHSTVT